MKQKEVFLQSEGDAWHARNHRAVSECDYERDHAARAVLEIVTSRFEVPQAVRLVEVGCGEGRLLQWLKGRTGCETAGIDPSPRAIEQARQRGVEAVVGTADSLPFESGSTDVVLFGFCLYLCDREDLFRIAAEADRILKPAAWLVISDFYAPAPAERPYSHHPGVRTFKMDYRTLFSWHPAYACYAHEVFHHGQGGFTDDPQEWAAVSVMRKLAVHG
jgi:SAM-dependent methyltransferase